MFQATFMHHLIIQDMPEQPRYKSNGSSECLVCLNQDFLASPFIANTSHLVLKCSCKRDIHYFFPMNSSAHTVLCRCYCSYAVILRSLRGINCKLEIFKITFSKGFIFGQNYKDFTFLLHIFYLLKQVIFKLQFSYHSFQTVQGNFVFLFQKITGALLP